MDDIVPKIAFLVIFAVVAYFAWRWWQKRTDDDSDDEEPMPIGNSAPTPVLPPQDPVPQGDGIVMYGNEDCPWCKKQKEYFKDKSIDYSFVDCTKPGGCPNFVHGYPTIVKDGQVMPGYQEI